MLESLQSEVGKSLFGHMAHSFLGELTLLSIEILTCKLKTKTVSISHGCETANVKCLGIIVNTDVQSLTT